MKSDEHDDLWELLGRAKAQEPSPFFSRNILRAIREEEQEKAGFLSWLRSHWQVAAISACAVVVVASFAVMQQPHSTDPVLVLAQQVAVSPDYEVISNLDELLDTERNSIWLEASLN